MKRIMLEDVIAHYEGGYEEIQAILDDRQRSTREKLAAIATASRALPVEALKDAILADVNAFTGGQFEDDATLIVVGIP